jgi:hypothetical protein
MESLTHSRMQSAKDCLRRHFLQFEFLGVGLKKIRTSEPLRFGTVIHRGLDLLASGISIDDLCQLVRSWYAEIPAWCQTQEEQADWFMECEKAIRLLLGYVWRWGEGGFELVATEQIFDIPLINPATGRESTNWRLKGRIDKVVREGSRMLLMEHKTTGDPIAPDSEYWEKLRIDSQISLYMLAARESGYPVETVIYDVIGKPQTRLRNPLYQMTQADKEALNCGVYFDERFEQDVLDGAVAAKRETPEMYGARLAQAITAEPDRYYARREIPRLDSDINWLRRDLWGIQKRISFCQHNEYWDQNTHACNSPWRCEMCEVCYGGFDVLSPGAPVPPGYILKSSQHEELEETHNANTNETTAATTPETPAA